MWTVLFHPDFSDEVLELARDVRISLAAGVRLIEQQGPRLKRPWCDTLKGSSHSNMKELRFAAADGVWRVAFAFDPKRRAVLLVGGDKTGVSQKKFYNALIRVADERFDDWLEE